MNTDCLSVYGKHKENKWCSTSHIQQFNESSHTQKTMTSNHGSCARILITSLTREHFPLCVSIASAWDRVTGKLTYIQE